MAKRTQPTEKPTTITNPDIVPARPAWGGYQQTIIEATGCAPDEAREAEDIMRNDIFHSTLDWQSRALFVKAARLAVKVLRGEPVPVNIARAIERGVPALTGGR
jgi:hypothetical protein